MGCGEGLRIVDARVLPAEIVTQLFGPLLGDEFHVLLGAELETAGGACFDASGFETLTDAVGAECALVNPLGLRIEARNIEGTTRHAELATEAVFVVKIDVELSVIPDAAVGRTSAKTTEVGTDVS